VTTPEPEAMRVVDVMIAKLEENRIATESLKASIRNDVDRLDQRGKENRALITEVRRHQRITAIATVIALLSLVVGGVLFVRQGRASDRADVAKQKADALVAYSSGSCEAGNKFRADNREIWRYLVILNKQVAVKLGKKPTDAETAALEKFQAKVNATFADRDCTKLLAGVR
jgi:hypothetical protein